MTVYNRQIAQCLRVIKKKGQLVTWVKQNVTRESGQPWKTNPGSDPTTFPVSIVFLSPKDKLFHFLTGTSVPTGAPVGLMASVPFTPEMNDSVLQGTDTLVVKTIDIVQPDGTPILYKIEFA